MIFPDSDLESALSILLTLICLDMLSYQKKFRFFPYSNLCVFHFLKLHDNVYNDKRRVIPTYVDPLTSILAAKARSWQIHTISWQPKIPFQDFHQNLTKYYYTKIVSHHDGQKSKIIKNTIPSVQAAETQSKGSFHPTTTVFTCFYNQNASTC